jgi:hypothetical protein
VTCIYRAFEQPDGTWSCTWWCPKGIALIDEHATLDDALAHVHNLAADDGASARLYAHWRNGRVKLMGEVGHRA